MAALFEKSTEVHWKPLLQRFEVYFIDWKEDDGKISKPWSALARRLKAGDSLNTNRSVWECQGQEQKPREEAGNWVCHGPFDFSSSFTFPHVGPLQFMTGQLHPSWNHCSPPWRKKCQEFLASLSRSIFKPAKSYLGLCLMPELPRFTHKLRPNFGLLKHLAFSF